MQTCKRCIYDSTIPEISFNGDGLCSYCVQYDNMNLEYPTGEVGEKILREYVSKMKRDGKGKEYDVVIGVSGGCDSSYMLHLAKEVYGLRPIAAHFDNTYNSKTAVRNIKKLIGALDIDLYTHVVDNEEFQRIFKSFFLASVPEIDTPTDLALATVHYQAAAEYGVKHIWEGHSFRTEGISPPGWFYMDAKYIDTIHKKFGNGIIKSLPLLWLHKWLYWIVVKKIKKFRPLYYIDYNKSKTKKFLKETYDWEWYGGHHMENRTSWFNNNYYLPKKFNIDLRLCEFSSLIRSNQMSREEAIEKMKEEKPIEQGIIDEIKTRVGFSEEEWSSIMAAEPKHFSDFQTYKRTFERMRPFFYLLYKGGYVTRSFYSKYCK